MRTFGIRSIGFWLLAGSLVLGAAAQPQHRPQAAEEFRVQHFTAADGLPSNEVYSIEEDSLGFLWLGTGNGLVRYDGYTFTTFLPRPGDSTSIGGSHIVALNVDATGHLWAGSGWINPGGLSRFDPATERFTRFRNDPNNPNSLIDNELTSIVTSLEDPGVLWVGASGWSTGHGLSRLDVATGTSTNFTTENGLASNAVWTLLVDREDTLWVGTIEGGLNRFDPATNTFTSFLPHPDHAPDDGANAVVSIHEDRAGVLWVGTNEGELSRFDRDRETFTSFFPLPRERGRVGAILADQAGVLWMSMGDGLFTFDRERKRFTRVLSLSAHSRISSIHEDRFGVLWIGSSGSLMKLDRGINPFAVYRHDPDDPNSLGNDAVWGIHEDRAGILWAGTGSWLNRLDRKTETISRYQHDPNAGRIYVDRAGTLWVTANSLKRSTAKIEAGLGCDGSFDRMDDDHPERFTRFQHDPNDPSTINDGCVNPMLEDQAGNFWIPVWGGGVDRMDRETETFTHYTHDSHGLGDDYVLRLYEAPSEPGVLWVGTDAGLSRFDTQAERFINYHATEHLRRSMMMHEDRQERFWVATASSGLHLFNRQTGTIEHTFTTEDGLAHNVVYSIHEDHQNFLWLSTANGLSKFDPETRTFRNYYVRDGLPGNAFHEGAHYQSASGELFFGGPDGAVSFFPEDLVDNPEPPDVVLTGLQIGDEPVKIGPGGPLEASMMVTKAITLSHGQNNLTFEYVGLHFIDPSQNRYRYMLAGYDEEWVEAGEQRTARYTNLDPGDYVFRVTARNGDGSWNEAGASVRLTILPPWWRTTWAYLFYALLFVASVFAVDRVQRRRLLRHERERARIQAAEHRAEVLQELDHLKSLFFVNVSHEFRTPLTLILGPLHDFLDGAYGDLDPRQHAHLSIMQRNGARLLRLLNQLLDLSKLEAGSMTLHARRADVVPVLRRLVAAFASRAERKHITLQFHAADDEIELYFETDKLEKVLTNLLSNAFKFTPEHGKIRVTVEPGLGEAGAYVEIAFKDTGRGIPEDQVPFIFDRFHQVDASLTREQEGTGIGLALVKELVALHGGTVHVESEAGFGTTFFVRLPQGRAHLTDAEVIDETPEKEHSDGMEMLDVSLRAVDAVLKAKRELFEADDIEQTTSEKKAPVHEPFKILGQPKILIVEDNADMRAYLRNHLAEHFRIEEAEDGQAGLEHARAVMPALVITDVMMPRLDGYALCRALKTDPTLNHIPVILLTAKASEESRLEGLEHGADAYLYKPFSMKELLVRVENLIAIRRRLRARFSDEVVLAPSEVVVSSEEAAFLERVREITEQHMAENRFGVERLAEEVGLGRRQLQRRLQALVDLSPSGYLRMMRLARATQLLEQQAGRVSEVGYAVGFGTAETFSRVFREVYGVPPSEYAARAEEEAGRGMTESDEDLTASDTPESSRG